MVVLVIHMVIIPTVVPVPTTFGMVPTASILTLYPPVVVLPVPTMPLAIPTVPTTSIVTVFPVIPENNVNLFNPPRVLPTRVEMGVRVLIRVSVLLLRVIVETVIMVCFVTNT